MKYDFNDTVSRVTLSFRTDTEISRFVDAVVIEKKIVPADEGVPNALRVIICLPVSVNSPLPANENPFSVSVEKDHFPALEICTGTCTFCPALNNIPSKKLPVRTVAAQAESPASRLNTAIGSWLSSEVSFWQLTTKMLQRQKNKHSLLTRFFI